MFMEVKTQKAMQPDRIDFAGFVEFEPEQSNDTTGLLPTARDTINVRKFQQKAVNRLLELRNKAYDIPNL